MYGPCLFTKTYGYGEKIANGYLIDNEMFINDNKLFVNNIQVATLDPLTNIKQAKQGSKTIGTNVSEGWLILAPRRMTVGNVIVEEGDWYHSTYGIFSGLTWCSMIYINNNCLVYGSLQGNFTINNVSVYSTPAKCAFIATFDQTGFVMLYSSIGDVGEFTCSQFTGSQLYIGGYFNNSSWNGTNLNGCYLFTFVTINNPTISLIATNRTYFNYILYPYHVTSQPTSQFLGQIGATNTLIFVTNSSNPVSKLFIVNESLMWTGYFSNTLQVTNLFLEGASDNDLGIVKILQTYSALSNRNVISSITGVSTAGVSSFITVDNTLVTSIYQREITPSIVKFVLEI